MAHPKPGPPGRHLAAMHGDLPHTEEAPKSPQHYLLECPLTERAWEAFYYIWQKWGAPNDTPPPPHPLLIALPSTSFGQRDAGSTSITNIPLKNPSVSPGGYC
jgi:hypothetical protein